jgi:hypothetical protein
VAPALTAGAWLLTLALSTPLALAVGGFVEQQVGSGVTADGRARRWAPEWATDLSAAATEPGRTFAYELVGFGGTVATLSRVFDRPSVPPALAGALVGHFVLWVFLTGGILDRLARGRRMGAAGFFAACGANVSRLLRLNLLMLPCYWALFAWLHPLLFQTASNRIARAAGGPTVEALWQSLFLAVFVAVFVGLNFILDFAKVRAVVEDRRSAIGALISAARFVRRRPMRIGYLYALNAAAQFGLGVLWLQLAPRTASPAWLALAMGQMFLVARLLARLSAFASEVAFFQGELAHAGYTAQPDPLWPDSPAVEAIRNRARLTPGPP